MTGWSESVMNKIGLIGTGNLAASIIKGLRQNQSNYKLFLYDVFSEKAQSLAKEYQAANCSLEEVLNEAEILLLAVKPKDIKALLEELSGYSLTGKLLITVAAGIGIAVYEKALPGIAVIRVMPNTSCAVLQAVSGMVRGKHVNDAQAVAGEKIFSAIGRVIWIEDNKVNALTAVSGSGPAYFYLLTELMALTGVNLGLTEGEAELLARETLIGAGKMLAEDSRSPQKLREAVTSPNGTTYAALDTFRREGLDKIVWQAMKACQRRAEEMEGEYGQ
ncbi:MAG: Pyrroline-5-carboxylate reductase [Candidatus Dichloromethanomonas elyunquensis]|nr:MAG: Pyrroline-5-carboxylate reductase [Candidatus Dichloromethanomonas elyunquensis]